MTVKNLRSCRNECFQRTRHGAADKPSKRDGVYTGLAESPTSSTRSRGLAGPLGAAFNPVLAGSYRANRDRLDATAPASFATV